MADAAGPVFWYTEYEPAAQGRQRGDQMSRASIIAHELGPPAVASCGDANVRPRTGDRVRVDGAQGVVEIL
jgi:phosphoenolpyruvate-protein kinase (PTS system EI component)